MKRSRESRSVLLTGKNDMIPRPVETMPSLFLCTAGQQGSNWNCSVRTMLILSCSAGSVTWSPWVPTRMMGAQPPPFSSEVWRKMDSSQCRMKRRCSSRSWG